VSRAGRPAKLSAIGVDPAITGEPSEEQLWPSASAQ